jgi:hypothetical protein
MMKVLPEPEASVRRAHNQSCDLLEPKAGIARTLVEHALFGRKIFRVFTSFNVEEVLAACHTLFFNHV